jgi:hypothetical protein
MARLAPDWEVLREPEAIVSSVTPIEMNRENEIEYASMPRRQLETFYPQGEDSTTVAEALALHTIAELELLARVAAVPSVGRKAERVAAFCEALEGDSLRFLLARLGPLERAAVAMGAHSRDGRLSLGGFRLRYGAEPDFG